VCQPTSERLSFATAAPGLPFTLVPVVAFAVVDIETIHATIAKLPEAYQVDLRLHLDSGAWEAVGE